MTLRYALLMAALLTLPGCSMDAPGPGASTLTLLSVSPANGVSGVSPTAPITLVFSHAMMQGAEMNVVLHQGTVTGPVVPGTAQWSDDRTVLTFTPDAPLTAATTYVLHLTPALMSATGQRLDHGSCARLGGQSVPGSMMGGGMMASGGRMANGSYGMTFSFTTA